MLTVAVISAVATAAGVVWFNTHKLGDAEVITFSTDTPNEVKPDVGYSWPGKPGGPKYISLPSINSGGYIQKVGVDQNRAIAVPNNVHFAGWFVESARPGDRGLSIIDGHVDGRESDGVFKRLAELSEGDTFTVEFGDGTVRTFRVTGVTSVHADSAENALFSQGSWVSSQLNLITCGGSFDAATGAYDERVIVASTVVE